jgi:hypothetical protein
MHDPHAERPGDPWAPDREASVGVGHPGDRRACGPAPTRRSPAMEPAWQAARALRAVDSPELQEVLQHPAFRRVPDDAQVPVSGCPVCGDGALHTAGTFDTSLGQLVVRACDTCGLVDLDPRLDAGLITVTRH